MTFPLGFWDLSLFLAVTAIILLITSELLSPHHGKVSILISRRRLKNAAMTLSLLFLTTVLLRIVGIILSL